MHVPLALLWYIILFVFTLCFYTYDVIDDLRSYNIPIDIRTFVAGAVMCGLCIVSLPCYIFRVLVLGVFNCEESDI